jgi:hypothetical protein
VADFAELAEGPWQDLTAVEGAYSIYEQGLFFECLKLRQTYRALLPPSNVMNTVVPAL